MASPQPHRGPNFKVFVTAAVSVALVAAPTAAAQTDTATDVDISSSQNVQISPDPAPPPAPPVQPTPDPVPAPQASTPPSGGGSPPAPPTEPAAPAEPAPAPAEPAPAAAPPSTPVAATATQAPSETGGRQSGRRGDRGKPQSSEKDRSTPVEKVNPLPVISELGPLANGLGDRATEAAPPIAIAALALLVLALTSGGFLAVAARRTGAWRT